MSRENVERARRVHEATGVGDPAPLERVEVVKHGWAAWSRGDLDAVFDVYDPAIEWRTTNLEGWPEEEVYSGHDGVRHLFEQWLESWEHYEAGVEKIVDVGDDRVLVLCWQRGFGRASQAPVELSWAQVITVRDGKMLRIENYSDRAEALEAMQLRDG